ncbi:transposase [Limosilactobacillus reuteri]|uniref:Transposase n=2 Tax=Limosilactobacillus reuteri TaxID=1598 RepID=A0A1Y4NQ85_LIMRT|nr:transposase [Limosilactobacillus reuteri]OUN40526.1 transposase [Limosilactobacillus reuteri]OUP82261.1 transposase [Limosilactobacillus reuteri]
MIAHFHYAASRGGEVIPQIIGPDYQGCLMCDGHSAYQQSRLPNGFLGACLIHVMRKFKELVKIGKGAKALEHSKAAKAVEKLGESLSRRGWSKLYNSGSKSSGTKAQSQTVVR